MDNIKILDFQDFYILISKINGNVLTVSIDEFNEKEYLNDKLQEYHMYVEIPHLEEYDRDLFKTVYISLHTSTRCNLSCTYCFKKERDNTDLSFEDSRKFIDMIVSEFPNAGKFIVDPTGSGEPLLNMDLLVQIADYCKIKSNEIRREVLPMLVTNGTLLTEENVDILQSSGYIFGVSIDGDKKSNDAYRKDYSGNGVYKKVIKNVKNIKHKQYIGAAVTLTDKNTNLVKTLKHLIKYFPTISIKPVRSKKGEGGVNEDNIEEIKEAYTKLFDFLLRETLQGNLEYIGALLNGDDYFGKFILRAILNQKVSTRCDAGLGRFSLSTDGNIYACPGGVDIEELVVGTLENGLDRKKMNNFWRILTDRRHCTGCFARFVCGGECMVNSFYFDKSIMSVDNTMCDLKKHLYNLALLYSFVTVRTCFYKSIYELCSEKSNRFIEDIELTVVLRNMSKRFTFCDLKGIKDEDYQQFQDILYECTKNR